MKLKDGELEVHYSVDYRIDSINLELDKAIEKCLLKFGYLRWASGYDLKTNVRDLAFRNKNRR